MSSKVEVISNGRCVRVRDEEIEELRGQGLSWYAYSQARLTRNHGAAVKHMTRFRRHSA